MDEESDFEYQDISEFEEDVEDIDIFEHDDANVRDFQFNIDEIINWGPKLTQLFKKIGKISQSPSQLYNDAMDRITLLTTQVLQIVFTGYRGEGKSECVNKFSCSEEWLVEHGIPKTKFGRFPLQSKLSGRSVTPIAFRMKKTLIDDMYYAIAKFTKSEAIFNARKIKLQQQNLFFPTEGIPDRVIAKVDKKGLLEFAETLADIKKCFTPQELIALDEVEVYGHWSFPDNFELIDLPGWDHDPKQNDLNKMYLIAGNVVVNVHSRLAAKGDLARLMQNAVFTDRSVFVSFCFADEDIDISNSEDVKQELSRQNRDLYNLLISLSAELDVPIPNIPSSNILERRNFCGRIARRSFSFFRQWVGLPAYNQRLFKEMRMRALTVLAEEICSVVGAFLMACKQLVTAPMDKATGKDKAKKIWQNATKKAESTHQKEVFDVQTILENLPTTILVDDEEHEKSLNSFLSYIDLVFDLNVKPSILKSKWEFITLLYSLFGGYWEKPDQEDEDLEADAQATNETEQILLMTSRRPWKQATHKLLQEQVPVVMNNSRTRIKDCITKFISDHSQELKDIDPNSEAYEALLDELCIQLQKLLEELFEQIQRSVLKVQQHVLSTTRTQFLDSLAANSNNVEGKLLTELKDEFNKECTSITQTLNKWMASANRFVEFPHLPKLNSREPFVIRHDTDAILNDLGSKFKLRVESKKKKGDPTPSMVHLETDKIFDDSVAWNENTETTTIIRTSLNSQKPHMTITLPKSLHGYLMEKAAKHEKDQVYPVFIVSWVCGEHLQDRRKLLEKIPFSSLDFEEDSLIFVVVEANQVQLYKSFLDETAPRKGWFILALPDSNLAAHVALDVAKLFCEHFKFAWSWSVDQTLKSSREWSRQVVGKTHPVTISRAMLGAQHIIEDMEFKTKQTVLQLIVNNRRTLLYSPHNKMTVQEQEQMDSDIERFREQLSSSNTEISLSEVIQFASRIQDEEIKNQITSKLDQFNCLSMLLFLRSKFQIKEILAHFVNCNPTLHTVMMTFDKRKKTRKLEGFLLLNTSALQGKYYGRWPVKNVLSPRDPSTARTLGSFHQEICDARTSLARKSYQFEKFLVILRTWSYLIVEPKAPINSRRKRKPEVNVNLLNDLLPSENNNNNNNQKSPRKKFSPQHQSKKQNISKEDAPTQMDSD